MSLYRGDVFHALQTSNSLGRLPGESCLHEAIATTQSSCEESRQARAELAGRAARIRVAGRALRYALRGRAQARTLAEDVALLVSLAPARRAGTAASDYVGRCALYDWVVAELRLRGAAALPPTAFDRSAVCWRTQRDALLAFAKQLDGDLQAWQRSSPGSGHAGEVEEVRDVLEPSLSQRPERWQRELGVVKHRWLAVRAWYAKPWRSCWGRWCVPAWRDREPE